MLRKSTTQRDVTHGNASPPHRFDLACHRLGEIDVAVHDSDIRSALSQEEAGGFSHALAAADDEVSPTGE
ncbi:hypothetical protein GCM10010461_17120 [Microbacterium aurantiacum]